MKSRLILLLILLLFSPMVLLAYSSDPASISLNGDWQIGFSRKYTDTVQVPGIAKDPTKMGDETLWYKKVVKLPAGTWTTATLVLKGARFRPQIYINGQLAGTSEGGMAPIAFLLKNNIKPGSTIIIEIALTSLKNVPQTDASYIASADHWRSNVSSCLWDDVVLRLHGDASISRIIPVVDYKSQNVSVKYELETLPGFKGFARVQITDRAGKVLINQVQAALGRDNSIGFAINGRLKNWSPDKPNLYNLILSIQDKKGNSEDRLSITFALKQFEIKNKQFYLNGQHFIARGPTVVWPRWMRTKEGRELGYDTAWFKKNIIQRTKDIGGNYLRFHLGLPPERFLDLCDRYGLAVQYEWSFFHAMPASEESLMIQYKSWLDLAMRHPSVSLIHPYNETGGDQLRTAWSALNKLVKDYPPLVLEDRDVMHIHKYWWSLFENLGLFYDNADVFPKAIMSDEFGGNYLDGNGDLGIYTTVKETFLRFLGRTNTATQRLAFHAESNAKVAEYWRRIGAAGFAPFCALASNEDGNHWFLGPLKEGRPKPVWAALTAAFSPRSVSMDIWDRNFEPGQELFVPVYAFNDESVSSVLSAKITVETKDGKILYSRPFTSTVPAFSKKIEQVPVKMPVAPGDYILKAELINKPASVKLPVISAWNIRVLVPVVPENGRNIKIAVASDEPELLKFLTDQKISTVPADDKSADLVITSLATWKKLAQGDELTGNTLRTAIESGKSVIMLDVGDRPLGQGYPERPGDFGPLQGVVQVSNPKTNTYKLFGGISLSFTQTAEPESHIHPDKSNRDLWAGMPDEATRLWNGMRGGLIVPAADMQFSGLSQKAFLAQWKARGADEIKIAAGPYYGYELQGFYEFSDKPNDKDTQKKLKDKVFFLVQDAPALASSINPQSPVLTTDLSKGYTDSANGMANNLVPLANCAKNLTQTPVALIDFGPGKGKLIASQLLTAGRLAKGFGQTNLMGIRYDPVAVQYVLNMINLVLKH